MTCTECNEPIPFHTEHITVSVAYSDERGVEQHCQHNPFDEADPAIVGVFGSRHCLQTWQQREQGNVH